MDGNKYVLEHFIESDIPIAAEIFTDIFINPPWNYGWLTVEKSLRYISDLFRTPGFYGFVFRLKDEPLDGICLGLVNDYFPSALYDIKEIFIRWNLQGGGLGSQMLASIEKNLVSRGIHHVTLFTQNDIPAYNFYLKNQYFISEETKYFSKKI